MKPLRKYLPSANALFVFEAVARSLSFSEAARELSVTQPAVSRMIAKLEDHLGVRLFDRTAKKVRLTEEGEQLRRVVSLGFNEMSEVFAKIELGRTEDEIVTFSMSSAMATHWLVPRLQAFETEFPNLELRFHLHSGEPKGALQNIDLAVRMSGSFDEGLDHWHLADDEVFAVCNRQYLASHGSSGGVASLDQLGLIGFDEPRVSWDEFLKSIGHTGRVPKQAMIFSDYSVVLESCLDGRGVALGWTLSVARLLAEGLLVLASDQSLKTGKRYDIVAPPTRLARPVVAAVRDWCIEEMNADVQRVRTLERSDQTIFKSKQVGA